MKLTLAVTALAFAGGHAFSENAVPKKWEKERYEETVAASPFVLETPKEEAKEPEPEEPMYVNLISNVENRPYVVIQAIGGNEPMRFALGEKGEDGITVTEIKMGETFKTSEVQIEQNGKRRWIKFNESSAATTPAPQPGGRAPGVRPGQPPSITPTINTGGAVVPAAPAASNIPRPTNVPTTVPRPSGSVQPPSFRGGRGGTPGAASAPGGSSGFTPNTGQQRVRVRTINNR